MFWNKDKIPNLKLEEEDQDLFKIDDEKEIEEAVLEEVNQERSKLGEVEEIESEKKEQLKTPELHTEKNIQKINKILNFIIIIIIIFSTLVIVDVILVSRTGKGPYFAIKTKTYNDGGTKVYYGLGYKVIKYNQKDGRKDIVLGNWQLKYDTTPIKTTILDLALDFNNNLEKALSIYMNHYLKVTGKIEKIEKDQIILIYKDEEKKYMTRLICNILNNSSNYHENDSVELVGTLYNYSKENHLKLYMKNCYIEK